MNSPTIREQIAAAILAKDYEKLMELKDQLKRLMWLKQFNGNVPIEAWLTPNPFIQFVD